MTENLIQAFQGLADSIIGAAPKVVVGILLLILALLVAKVIERAVRFLLTKLASIPCWVRSVWTRPCRV